MVFIVNPDIYDGIRNLCGTQCGYQCDGECNGLF